MNPLAADGPSHIAAGDFWADAICGVCHLLYVPRSGPCLVRVEVRRPHGLQRGASDTQPLAAHAAFAARHDADAADLVRLSRLHPGVGIRAVQSCLGRALAKETFPDVDGGAADESAVVDRGIDWDAHLDAERCSKSLGLFEPHAVSKSDGVAELAGDSVLWLVRDANAAQFVVACV